MLVQSIVFQMLIVLLSFSKQISSSHNESSALNNPHSNINIFEYCGNNPNDIFSCIAGVIYFLFLVALITGIIFCICLFYKCLLLLVALDELRTLRLHQIELDEIYNE